MTRTRLQLCALLLAFTAQAGLISTMATAQDMDRTVPTAVDRNDDGFDMGWLGLLGLLGFAGLAGRNRNHTRTGSTRDETVAHR